MEYYILSSNPDRKIEHPSEDIILLAEVLKVAIEFDLNTGMMMGHKPQSEIMAMQFLQKNTTAFNETIVSILAQCIHIIPKGASVDLSTKDKAIVLVENPKNYMEPVILRLYDNTIYDLSDPDVKRRFQIVDIMKTMDNRIEIDEDTIKHFKADPRLIEMTERLKKRI